MLVDDHAFTRKHMASLIDLQPGLSVVAEAGSGEEALPLATHIRPDLIVMDILLPMMNGIDATRAIIAAHPGQKILVLSNYEGNTLIESIKSAGALGFVKKDEAYEELIPAILDILSGRTHFGSAGA